MRLWGSTKTPSTMAAPSLHKLVKGFVHLYLTRIHPWRACLAQTHFLILIAQKINPSSRLAYVGPPLTVWADGCPTAQYQDRNAADSFHFFQTSSGPSLHKSTCHASDCLSSRYMTFSRTRSFFSPYKSIVHLPKYDHRTATSSTTSFCSSRPLRPDSCRTLHTG